jgi:hypothetical protein
MDQRLCCMGPSAGRPLAGRPNPFAVRVTPARPQHERSRYAVITSTGRGCPPCTTFSQAGALACLSHWAKELDS